MTINKSEAEKRALQTMTDQDTSRLPGDPTQPLLEIPADEPSIEEQAMARLRRPGGRCRISATRSFDTRDKRIERIKLETMPQEIGIKIRIEREINATHAE